MTRIEGTLYRRAGSRFWYADYSASGRRVQESTGTADRREAASFLAQRKREVKEGTWQPGASAKPSGSRFAADWAAWLGTRDDVKTLDDDRSVGEHHILPTFGELATSEITTAHVLDWHGAMRRKTGPRGKPLSKNFIRNVDARLVTFFADMEQRGAVTRTPYAGLRKSQRLKRATRHEIADTKRVFGVAEIEALAYDERIPADRRVFWALTFFAGARFGEAAGLRWSDYETKHEPLGMLRIVRQYDGEPLKGKRNEPGAPRRAPVHAALAAILAEWKLAGFPALMGRAPKDGDHIVPSRAGRCRSLRHMGRRLREDLERVGLAPTDQTHAFRRAFKTIAVANGAPEVWIERVIHNASGGVAAGYLADDWAAMCGAVARIPVARPKLAGVVPLRAVAGDPRDSQRDSGDFRGTSDVKKSGVDGTRKGPPLGNVRDIRGTSGRVGDPLAPSFSGEETPRTQPVTLSRAEARAALLALAERLDDELAADVRALVARR